ncbi:MAG: hypothetical protein ACRDGW_08430 [Actinomycetota bacterium]
MSVSTTMKWMGRSARNKAEAVGHQMKDRALEKRLERASEEADRLRFENDLLRDEVSETRSEHHRILDLIESRMAEPAEEKNGKKSHKGRWLLFLVTLGGGAYAWMRMRSNGHGADEWSGPMSDSPTVTGATTSTQSTTSTL